MDDGCLLMQVGERRLKLEGAAGIASGDDISVELRDEPGFAIAQGFSGVWLNEIVNAGGAAADGGFGNFSKFQTRDAGEQSARLRAHALGVLQVAGVVECHAES